jgi:exonuclease SbcD
MRFLHTADWHVGRTIRRRQRLDETRTVLEDIVGIAENETVDAVLVCGDIYETFAPSAEAERIVYDTLLALTQRVGVPVVLVAGNHDYAKRLTAVEGLLKAVNVHVAAEPRRPDEGGVIEVRSRSGGNEAQIAVLPWVAERRLFGAEEMMGLQEEPHKAYAEQTPRLLQELCAHFDQSKVNLLAAHLFISGARPGGGERELTIGEIFAITGAALPTTPQYIALGHVHRPQEAPGTPVPTRYAGSALQLDFGDVDQQKSVTIVDVEPGKPARAREIPLSAGRRLIDIRVRVDQLESQAGADQDAYARVFLECDGPAPGLVERVQEILPNAVEVRLVYERQDPERAVADYRAMTPGELFSSYYQKRHGSDPDKRLLTLFNELFEEVSSGAPSEA